MALDDIGVMQGARHNGSRIVMLSGRHRSGTDSVMPYTKEGWQRVVLVGRWRDEKEEGGDSRRYCAAKRKRSAKYADNIKTICGFYVVLPLEVRYGELSEITCPGCLSKFPHDPGRPNPAGEAGDSRDP